MQRIVRGRRDHPGLPIAAFFTLMGAVAGADRGMEMILGGAAIMGLLVWPPVLISAWERGR